MRYSSPIFLLATSSALVSASAIPAQLGTKALQSRATGTRDDPHWMNIDCSRGEQICNSDCHAILCYAVPNPTQYDAKKSDNKRKLSGYSSKLLRAAETVRQSWGIFISQPILDVTGFSVEETVMANAREGGEGEILVAGDAYQNSLIGSRVGGGIKKYGVANGDFYFRWFTNYGNFAPYCSALQGGRQDNFENYPGSGTTPDVTKCPETDKAETDPSRVSFVKTNTLTPDGKDTFHMMSFAAGDRWTGKYWSQSGTLKEKREGLGNEDEKAGAEQ